MLVDYKVKQDYYISSNDSSQTLHYVVWLPAGQPVGVVQLVHGMEEYVDRYDGFAKVLTEEGWAVIGHDHLGHGLSGKWERGFFTEKENGADVLIDDMHTITTVAHELWRGLPVFIFGHSMGSFFVRRYLAEYGKDVSGAIVCGSGWYAPIATGVGYYAARVIGGIKGFHKKSWLLTSLCSLPFLFAFRNEGKGAWLSKNKENVRWYNANPQCGFGFTCGGYRDMYRNLLFVSQHYHYERLIDMPVLVISGEDDAVGGRRSVGRIADEYRRWGVERVTEKVVDGDRHEILFEEDADETMRFIARWLSLSRPTS